MFIDAYEVILLDQARTFMFGVDRFGPDENFSLTYRRIGGTTLSDRQVNHVVSTVFKTRLDAYEERKRDDNFPTVRQAISEAKLDVSDRDIDFIDDLMAEHEIGPVPETHKTAIHALSTTHRLGIISNIWGQPARFEHNLQNAGIFDCFEHIVWSSAYGESKPSPNLFAVATNYWDLEPDRILLSEMIRSGTSVERKLRVLDVYGSTRRHRLCLIRVPSQIWS
jgi:putative hydrolase of the HAD superfamily